MANTENDEGYTNSDTSVLNSALGNAEANRNIVDKQEQLSRRVEGQIVSEKQAIEASLFKLESTAFHDGDEIPEEYTADGENISPPLKWTHVPRDTRELVLVCEDPDAPRNAPFVHWVAYGIAPNAQQLTEGIPARQIVEVALQESKTHASRVQLVQGVNSAGEIGYFGPQPPPETGTHRYYFRLFALDEELNLPPGLEAQQVLDKIRDHILGEADLVGRYWYH